ncbi:MAG: phosphogluconate dehydratase [Crocinitomicaceae bacterium]|jgi:phosphogluconate dehydratase|nr:phosphogluconate dehydratase [Crocinitomicaceae bacterium]MDP4867517.1 phosphogluconate dehydratase [Crocinitomicaceae bacterium]MDP5042279.1 phosphogluconate dehydratase [Crocinitomicaceae bacterium]MDP5066596.1 phosphogluconate dehydratase [Crocinitomicaceae bacterium]
MIHPVIASITERIVQRSLTTRKAYLAQIDEAYLEGVHRSTLNCGNLAHGFAACNQHDKAALAADIIPNLGIITAYNDMLSAHQVYEDYPKAIKQYANAYGAVAQVAGAVPAMCDGVTQGQAGMELSLYSRDVIALSSAIGLSHNMFDAALYLGICDKIVPGLLMSALRFGHLPAVFMPGGPMPSGISNEEKSAIRQAYAEGKIGREELLKGESDSYHSPGTCTFYGTANSNQMLMEIMGLHLPGSSFVNPNTPLRDLLNKEAVRVAIENVKLGKSRSLANLFDEKTVVNGIIGLLATGGSTNHTIHLIAIARAAGIIINWDDMSDLSAIVPLITRMYPNGAADVNHFHAAGGMGFVIGTLLEHQLLHEDVQTIIGQGLRAYTQEPKIKDGVLVFEPGARASLNLNVIRPANEPFTADGGIKLLQGNLGRAVIKTAAVAPEHRIVEAPAIVFHEQTDLMAAFKRGELDRDFIAVVPFQGPKFNGMPELHSLTPTLTILQKKGFKVGLVTDGRMSGASGKVPAAIHLTPEAYDGGLISKIQTGDLLRLDSENGIIEVLNEASVVARAEVQKDNTQFGFGRELFAKLRAGVSMSEEGASFIV